jgi:hypothetical protein
LLQKNCSDAGSLVLFDYINTTVVENKQLIVKGKLQRQKILLRTQLTLKLHDNVINLQQQQPAAALLNAIARA